MIIFKTYQYVIATNQILENSASSDSVPEEIQLLKSGYIETEKGNFLVDAIARRDVIAHFRTLKNDVVIDYEHQTLQDIQAPAAGWIIDMTDRGEDGVWAKVKWNTKAQEYLKNREYRYLSPVVLARKSDQRAARIHSAALTNKPAIDGMVPIVAKLNYEEETNVDFFKKVQTALGLSAEATEQDVIDKVIALKGTPPAEVVACKEVLEALALKEGASVDDVKAQIIALKNPSGYVSVQEFQSLKDKMAAKERDELVSLALTQGKVAPAQKAWAEEYALKDPSGFKAFLEKAPKVVPVGDNIPPAGSSGAPAVEEMQTHVNSMLGIKNDEYQAVYGKGDDK